MVVMSVLYIGGRSYCVSGAKSMTKMRLTAVNAVKIQKLVRQSYVSAT